MYIAPNSIIKVLRGVPLDTTYDHTIFFLNNSAQYNYFNGKTKYTFLEQSYQRVKRGWIRVGRVADDLYDCNYLMFQNANYGNKWFYAFIKSIEYINNAVCEIEFEIDVMQTWHFNYTLNSCYVEREHTAVGETSSFYTPEPLEPGTMVYHRIGYFDMNPMNVAVLYTPSSGHGVSGQVINKTYFGAMVDLGYAITDPPITIDNLINDIIDHQSDIIALYQYPSWANPDPNNPTAPAAESYSVDRPTSLGEQWSTTTSTYTPRNKKLLFYPYVLLRVSDRCGKNIDYAFELFNTGDTALFTIRAIIVPQCQVVVAPLAYKGDALNYEEKLIYSNFPECCWAVDSYRDWLANNKYNLSADVLTKCVNAIAGIGVTGQMQYNSTQAANNAIMRTTAGSATDLATLGINIAVDAQKAYTMGDTVYGNTTQGNLNAALDEQKIGFYTMTIRKERAQIIDEFFDRYGYACQRNKVPNRNVRPVWCYTKTKGCTITGTTGVPCDDMKKICAIYDHGITFWKNGDNLGNYSYDNTINELGDEE